MRNLLLVAPLFLLVGCFKTEMVNFSAKGTPGPEVKIWSHSLIAGLIPLTEVDTRAACGNRGIWAVSVRPEFLANGPHEHHGQHLHAQHRDDHLQGLI